MPQKRPEDRMRIWRIWTRQIIRENRHFDRHSMMQPLDITPVPTDEEVVAAIVDWKSQSFDENRVAMLAGFFNPWLAALTAQTYQKRAHTAAQKRWSKKRR
jgi:hypothetical protein